MKKYLLCLMALFPSYLSMFTDSQYLFALIHAATILVICASAHYMNEERVNRQTWDNFHRTTIVYIIGLMIAIAKFNL